MYDIHTVLHREAATCEGQRRRRPEALQLGRLLIPETVQGGGPVGVGLSAVAGAVPATGLEARGSPPLPFPNAQSPGPRPPNSPLKTKRDFFFPVPVRSKFISLSRRSGPPGFVVRQSELPRQGREPKESLNYNPHDARRAWRSRAPPSPRTGASARGTPQPTALAFPAVGGREGLSARAPHYLLYRLSPCPSDSLPRRRRSGHSRR